MRLKQKTSLFILNNVSTYTNMHMYVQYKYIPAVVVVVIVDIGKIF